MSLKKENHELEQQILQFTDLLIESTIASSILDETTREAHLQEAGTTVSKMANLLVQYLGGHEEHLPELLRQLARQKLPDENILESFEDFNGNLDQIINHGLRIFRGEIPLATANVQETGEIEGDGSSHVPENFTEAVQVEEDVAEGGIEASSDDHGQLITADRSGPAIFEISEEDIRIDQDLESSSPSVIIHQEIGDLEPSPESAPSQEDTGKLDYLELALKRIFPGKEIIKDYALKDYKLSYFIPELSLAVDAISGDVPPEIWKDYHCRERNIKLIRLPSTTSAHHRQLSRILKRYLAGDTSQSL